MIDDKHSLEEGLDAAEQRDTASKRDVLETIVEGTQYTPDEIRRRAEDCWVQDLRDAELVKVNDDKDKDEHDFLKALVMGTPGTGRSNRLYQQALKMKMAEEDNRPASEILADEHGGDPEDFESDAPMPDIKTFDEEETDE